ncbi:Putative aryl-alcohol oxidase vanillyl-alcohol oxidase [Tolypocladium paradoxum]|uniref:Aryl-alcohol oxidase vanillyl-alcohol oxidase n=1 Tax=Tolypocladium paradoxum TaxID=94208 RepID=A0A2S4KTP7_9HYPO|nr:Putative aryl-alcohol oxidase vanillyl-alcohol oxidase [Tolypocladium paradoxum]
MPGDDGRLTALSTFPVQDPPTLHDRYSGIPERLLEKARKAKEQVYRNQTKQISSRVRLPVVPKGISHSAFGAAIRELQGRLGTANVVLNDQALDDGWYMEHPNTHDAFNLLESEETVASAIAYPGNTAEVQAIVLWANEHGIPIYPISMGRNRKPSNRLKRGRPNPVGYGGAAPRVRGSVVVDLGKRMNKILDINPNDYTCLVEPGVSFYALHEAIQAQGYDHVWIDVPDLGGGSVLGNTLDRGVGYTPYGDHWAVHSGLEVVLPTGEVVRTGMGAMPGSTAWQTFPYGFGPLHDGLFSQSNFGIVTKMGMTLMPNPGGSESFMYTFPKEEDLAQLVEIIRPLRISNILENVAQLKHCIQEVAALGRPRSEIYQGEGTIPMEVIRRELRKLPCGDCTWIYYGTAYGPEHIRKYKLDIIDREFKKVLGSRRVDPDTIPADHYFWARHRVASGIPDLHELAWLNWLPNGGHVFFSPVSSITGSDAKKLLQIAKRRHREAGLDMFPAFCVGLREMHLILNIVYDRDDPKSREAATRCMRAMIDDAAKEGYGEYRTHLIFQDQVMKTYSWNDNALSKLNAKLKDALDPAGILAPGRCGVWPARYRGRGWEMGMENRTDSEGSGIAPGPQSSRL